MKNPIHILVIEGRYYHHISDALLLGAEMALRELGATSEVVTVPGALEIPQILSVASDAGLFFDDTAKPFHGCVALGCVIRGDTIHFEIVSQESARGLMALSMTHALPIGNGIITVNTQSQAFARARMEEMDKGGDAARAALARRRR